MLYSSIINTPLGPMIAVADNEFLYCLSFLDQKGVGKKISQISLYKKLEIVDKNNKITLSIKLELASYFNHKLISFITPIYAQGTAFQQLAWEELRRVPYGSTISYTAQASNIDKSKAYRAVANANGNNPLSIVIPCHRVVLSNGSLGGYNGGIERKKWLIDHEIKFSS